MPTTRCRAHYHMWLIEGFMVPSFQMSWSRRLVSHPFRIVRANGCEACPLHWTHASSTSQKYSSVLGKQCHSTPQQLALLILNLHHCSHIPWLTSIPMELRLSFGSRRWDIFKTSKGNQVGRKLDDWINSRLEKVIKNTRLQTNHRWEVEIWRSNWCTGFVVSRGLPHEYHRVWSSSHRRLTNVTYLSIMHVYVGQQKKQQKMYSLTEQSNKIDEFRSLYIKTTYHKITKSKRWAQHGCLLALCSVSAQVFASSLTDNSSISKSSMRTKEEQKNDASLEQNQQMEE